VMCISCGGYQHCR